MQEGENLFWLRSNSHFFLFPTQYSLEENYEPSSTVAAAKVASVKKPNILAKATARSQQSGGHTNAAPAPAAAPAASTPARGVSNVSSAPAAAPATTPKPTPAQPAPAAAATGSLPPVRPTPAAT